MSATLFSSTAASTGAVTANTLAATTVNAPAGATIVCYLFMGTGAALTANPDWGGTALSAQPVAADTSDGAAQATIFYLAETPAAEHTVTANFDAAIKAAMIVEVWLGMKQTPEDQVIWAPTGGSGTSPSSGATGVTTQASEMCLGIIGTNGPSSDTVGTASNGWTLQARVGTTGGTASGNRTVQSMYKIVSATGAQTAAKTGITSRSWAAGVVTFKLESDVAITAAAPGSATVGAPTATPTPGDTTVTAAAPGGATVGAPATSVTVGGTTVTAGAPGGAIVGAPDATVDLALTITAGAPGATLCGVPDASTIYTFGTDANGIVDAPTTLTEGAASIAQSRGIRSFGVPYFAMWMQAPAGFVDQRYPIVAGLLLTGGFAVVAAINAPPTQIASVDEVHYFASYHEVGGIELLSLGVTPDLRLALKTSDGPVLYSAPGTVVADGVARTYTISTIQDSHFGSSYRSRLLMVNELIVAQDTRPGTITYVDGNVSPTGKSTRVMIFNGVEGKTLLDCTVFALRYRAALWPMTPIVGVTTPGYESTGGIGEPVVAPEFPNYPAADFTLTAGFFDPRPFYPALAGDFPSSSAQAAFARQLNTQYRLRTIVRPDYRLVGAS